MIRLAAFGRAAVVLASIAATGCATTDGGDWSVRKALGWDDERVPRGPDLPKGQLEAAEKVENLGRRIIAQYTFAGIEPMINLIGVPETVFFHRGPEEMWVSEGLVSKCKTEGELAAVLCSELGQMIAEKKAARRLGAERDTIPDSALPGGVSMGGGNPDDPGRSAERAYQERRLRKGAPILDAGEASKISRDLLKSAGFDPAELDRVEPLLKQSERGVAIRKQMSGSAAAPKWDR